MKMKRSVRTLTIALPLLGLAPAVEAARVEERVERVLPASPGETLTVRNRNGAVRVDSWDRREVKVEARKLAEHWRRSVARADLERIEVTIEAVDGGVSLETRMPRRNRTSRVDVTILVPSRFDLDIQTSNGRIEVHEVEGRSRLRTSNGRVDLQAVGPETEVVTSNGRVEVSEAWGRTELRTSNGRIVASRIRGSATLRTSNGRIEADVVAIDATDSLILSSSNGSITARLPTDLRADLDARTRNGTIYSDFPVTTVVHGRQPRNVLEGTIAAGGTRIEARTTNGSIRFEAR